MLQRSNPRPARSALVAIALLLAALSPLSGAGDDGPTVEERRALHALGFGGGDEPWEPRVPDHVEECIAGTADGYPCERVDLLEVMTPASLGGGSGSDIWGWTDPLDDHEYALMGLSNGTAFVDITDPADPIYLGNLPTSSGNSSWRDIKTYNNYAYIVADYDGAHGMQVFDLTDLRNVVTPPVTFVEAAHYSEFDSTHNIVINEESGFAYAVGISQVTSGSSCSGGLHMIDLANPIVPTFAGCFSADGYTHDAQCVNYIGPDSDHAGAEVCFNSNEDTLTIVDVSDKNAPVQLAREGYAGSGYTHQGWLTEDHLYYLMDDETDEIGSGHNTRTYIWDVQDLDAPALIGTYDSGNPATDHNLYIRGNFAYEANYRSGLRILALNDIANGNLSEIAYFDTFPDNNNVGTSQTWSVYPFFDSGTVIVSSTGGGLFVLRPRLCEIPAIPTALSTTPNGDHSIQLSWSSTAPPEATFDVFRSLGSCPGNQFELVASGVLGTTYTDNTVSGTVPYSYQVRASIEGGLCLSELTACSSTTTTGSCTAPPIFGGLQTVTNPAASACALDLGWNAASGSCGIAIDYSVYRSTTPGFVPDVSNRIASGLNSLSFQDSTVLDGQDYQYVVRSKDLTSGTEDPNSIALGGRATGPTTDGTWATGLELGDPTVVSGSGVDSPDAPEHIGWEIVGTRQHTGDRSLFSTYVNGQCTWIATPPLQLSAGEASQLSFWTAFDIENEYDGGVVQTSTNGGSTWTLLNLDQGYPGSFDEAGNQCGFALSTPAFTGENQLTWTEYTADLSGFAGQEVQVRWLFSTDGGLTLEGWYVDDIAVTHASIPGQCTSGLLFGDGFETGSTGEWTATQP
ncbi:MAG: choice-of-anchor B family protein [Thermoanaerobaculia bacterium]|nr:choice-of-anchor B family protein [Thermoanaerobaculia bacterium]